MSKIAEITQNIQKTATFHLVKAEKLSDQLDAKSTPYSGSLLGKLQNDMLALQGALGLPSSPSPAKERPYEAAVVPRCMWRLLFPFFVLSFVLLNLFFFAGTSQQEEGVHAAEKPAR